MENILGSKIYIFFISFFPFHKLNFPFYAKKNKKNETFTKDHFYGCKIKFSETFLIYYHIGTGEVLREDNVSRYLFRLFSTKNLIQNANQYLRKQSKNKKSRETTKAGRIHDCGKP